MSQHHSEESCSPPNKAKFLYTQKKKQHYEARQLGLVIEVQYQQ